MELLFSISMLTGPMNDRRMDAVDALPLAIPHIVLASKDEPAEAVAGYAKTIESSSQGGAVETYSNMWHGWMSARADLDGEESRAEYIRG
ncbi:unnamed protein product [Penicillium salamii]|uniref:Uncharacterized protein n=1 Tax=Penicillium salamii TaxID=1612424 RepID=A0A9W4J1T1_9EURO|nr:unnamed protein product [Penicillium salamii]CAG8110594.1 unnamed protein product [Penicillium salamii]CAG8113510.1 unnamed protein product [Penicillium salamii]CAG8174297.1 unnamed protein product [Penicillium salamii]CAG8181860.1 unnamed protein product [Penicillium salamii]